MEIAILTEQLYHLHLNAHVEKMPIFVIPLPIEGLNYLSDLSFTMRKSMRLSAPVLYLKE